MYWLGVLSLTTRRLSRLELYTDRGGGGEGRGKGGGRIKGRGKEWDKSVSYMYIRGGEEGVRGGGRER